MRKKYYEDAKENAAFERCVDVIASPDSKIWTGFKTKMGSKRVD